jgi:TonB family protein
MRMNEPRKTVFLLLLVLLILSTAPRMGSQRPPFPPPSGNRIVVQDGEVIVVENDARVRIVRRREAHVRAVFNAGEHWLLLLVDHATSARSADGRVDWAYYYRNVGGTWPLGPRWEGDATIEEYSMVAPGGPGGWGLATPHGLVQLLGSQGEFRDSDALAVLSYTSGGSSIANEIGFDEAERWFTAELRRNDSVMRAPSGAATSVSMTVGPAIGGGSDPNGAVRVGGNVRPPVKVVDVLPVLPEEAARAGVRGTVVLEVTIDVDGTVKDARVLRSVPMLDAAALEAVRQWRYEPTNIGGKPVPIITTVSVAF